MELRELKSFLKIMELESFSRAAKELGYSQSALSVQIHSLENELGVRLFDRMGKQVALTPPGRQLARRVLPILQEVEELENVMHNRPPAEALRIGMIESLCKAHMPQVMDYVCRNLPQLHITITIDSPSVLLDALNHNKVDLVYVLDKPLYDGKWEKVFQKQENIVFVCSVDSPLAREKDLKLDQVIRQPFFLTEKADNYRLSLDQQLAARQLALNPILEVSDTGFILDMVQRGLGLSFLPQYVVENSPYRDRLQILQVKDFHMHMYRQLFYHKDKWLTQAMKVFLRLALRENPPDKGEETPDFSWNREKDSCTDKGSMI
ncbi:LysR family transcriptional regulator [Acidaminococcus fermentans]|uniref:LysR family transcriptional regulator n=1 Tax=Acidaminococcus fermentans TaxID=905 RepID=UPI00242FC1E8|nr:LysR family transcriptional regulator [Acidaminococcus fermentans]